MVKWESRWDFQGVWEGWKAAFGFPPAVISTVRCAVTAEKNGKHRAVAENAVNEMVRCLISTPKVGDCVGRFKEDHRYADLFGWH